MGRDRDLDDEVRRVKKKAFKKALGQGLLALSLVWFLWTMYDLGEQKGYTVAALIFLATSVMGLLMFCHTRFQLMEMRMVFLEQRLEIDHKLIGVLLEERGEKNERN